jgi:prepilin peptidase CpaA
MEVPLAASAVVLGAALVAAVTDVWKFKIHNAITLPLLLTGLLFHALVPKEYGALGWADSLCGALFGFGVLLPVYLMGGMGGGDVKLLAAVGAWLGITLTVWVFITSALVQGLYAVFLVLRYGNLGETWLNLQVIWHRLATISRHLGAEDGVEAEANRVNRRRLIPFAAMLACGILVILVWSWVVKTTP